MIQSNHLTRDKSALRRRLRVWRDALPEALREKAAETLANRFMQAVPLTEGQVVAGYWPFGSEFDPRPLLERLHHAGMHCVLPCVVRRDAPLFFRSWAPGVELIPGPLGIMQPPISQPKQRPEVVLTPLLGFDKAYHRLGYGGGYYDRTFEVLDADGPPVIAIGLAFDGQEVDSLPVEPHDRALDRVMVEST